MSRFVLTAQLQLQAPGNTQQVINQIRSQLQGGIDIPVSVRGSDQSIRQINQVNQATQQVTDSASRMGKAIGASIQRFAAFNVATRAVSFFASKLTGAIEDAIDFDHELTKVSQVTGKTVEELGNLTKTITGLSTGLGVSSADLLKTAGILAQAGVKAGDLNVALEVLAKTTLAPTFDNITETAEGVVAILSQFGEGVGALEKQLGAINAVSAQFAVESDDLIESVRRVGGVFKSAGGDLNELIALFTSVRATTRENSESISTGLRTIFTRIQRPATIAYLEQLGVKLTDLKGKFVGPYEAIKRLSEAFSKMEQGDLRFVQIAEELGGFRQIGKVIPLLQQFELAEEARQAALAGGNSLNKDVETSQRSLSIQIEKTREKFLALIRDVSQTTSFRLLVQTLLGLANAFIGVADAMKPIIPIITALAAIKFAKGFGSFVSGIGAGIAKKSKGGIIQGFARGGVVPGTGNRDTVPAMLTPGEFVIRKSSVSKIGADNLSAMNNGYAAGGVVTGSRHFYGNNKPKQIANTSSVTYKDGVKSGDTYAASKSSLAGSVSKKTGEATPASFTVGFNVVKNAIGGFILQPPKGKDASYTPTQSYVFTLPYQGKTGRLIDRISKSSNVELGEGAKKAGVNAQIMPASYPVFYPGYAEGKKGLQKNAAFSNIANRSAQTGLQTAISHAARLASKSRVLDFSPAINVDENLIGNITKKMISDSQTVSTIEGYVFEGMIGALTGATPSGGKEHFDFPRSSIKGNLGRLTSLFGYNPKMESLMKAEAKRSKDEFSSVTKKLSKDIIRGDFLGVKVEMLASGGGVSGSDTVPAMLTPGEFVVNKKSAQSIGYGNLNRMNKKGVVGYARGGVVNGVQKFATGGSPSPTGEDIAKIASFNKLNMAMIAMTSVVGVASMALESFGDKSIKASQKQAVMTIVGERIVKTFTSLAAIWGAYLAFSSGALSFAKKEADSRKEVSEASNGLTASLQSAQAAVTKNAQVANAVDTNRPPTPTATTNEIITESNTVIDPAVRKSELEYEAAKKTRNVNQAKILKVKTSSELRTEKQNLRGLKTQIERRGVPQKPRLKVGDTQKHKDNMIEAYKGKVKIHEELTQRINQSSERIKFLSSRLELCDKATEGWAGSLEEAENDLKSSSANLNAKKQKLTEAKKQAGKITEPGKAAAARLKSPDVAKGASAVKGAAAKTAAFVASGATIASQVVSTFAETFQRESDVAASKLDVGRAVDNARTAANFQSQAKLFTLGGAIEGLSDPEGFVKREKANRARIGAETGVSVNKALQEDISKAITDTTRSDFRNANGEFLANKAIQKSQSGFSEAKAAIAEVQDPEERKRLTREMKTDAVATTQSLIEAGASSDEIDKFIQNVAGSSDELRKAMEKAAKGALALKAAQEAVAKANYDSLKITSTFNAASLALTGFIGSIDGSRSALENNIAIMESAQSNIGIDGSKAIESIEKDLINALPGSNKEAGDVIKRQADKAKKVSSFNTNLNNALSGLKLSTSNPGQAKADLERAAIDAAGGDEDLKKIIQAKIANISDEDIGKTDISKFISELQADASALSKGFVESAKILNQTNQQILQLTSKRREAELQYFAAQKEAINGQLEAAGIIEEFGGKKLTPEDQKSANIAQFNASAAAAGVSGLSTGSVEDFSRVGNEIAQQLSAQTAKGVTPGGFGDQIARVDNDKRKELVDAQKELIQAAKARVSQIRQELAIIQKKNALEKSSLEKLVSGDVQGFIEGQAAVGAASAIRAGDMAGAQAFGADAISAAFKDAQSQGLPPQELAKFSQAALAAAGVTNSGANEILSDTTQEEQRLREEGQGLGGVIGNINEQMMQAAQVNMEAQNVVLNAAYLKRDEALRKTADTISPDGKKEEAPGMFRGGVVYANRGIFVPRGTDTVPAMLTPGEFVVNRSAVQRGNNLAILQAMNNGQQSSGNAMARGGRVRYYSNGSSSPVSGGGMGISMDVATKLSTSLDGFVTAVNTLGEMKLSVKLDTTNVNVNFNGASFLSNLSDQIRTEVLNEVARQIPNIKPNQSGGNALNQNVL